MSDAPHSPKNLPGLILDDEDMIRAVLQETLEDEGFPIIATGDPREAIEILASQPLAFFISDQRMPTASGLDVLAKAYEIAPDVPRFLLSGALQPSQFIEAINSAHVFGIFLKPWDPDTLTRLLTEARAFAQRRADSKP